MTTLENKRKCSLNKGKVDDHPPIANADERPTYGRPVEFLFSCISMSVGLGNVWRFPSVAAKNGGGAFLIPYLLVLLFIGRPLYYLEMCLGQFSRYGQVKCWSLAPVLKGVGYAAVISVISCYSYYVPLMAITVHYFFSSFAKELPWATCNQDQLPQNLFCNSSGAEANYSAWYFKYSVFPQVDSLNNGVGEINWGLAGCLLISWIVICVSLIKGVKSSGKVAYFTAIFPYAVLLILLIRGLTLPGSWKGIKLFIYPQWDQLLNPMVWYSAIEQCFFSLGVAFGLVINCSSYNKFRHNIYRDAIIISFMDTFTSLLAGVTVYAVMGNMMAEHGLVDVKGGPDLAFVVYPRAIAFFSWAPQIFAILFFLMMFTLGLGSATNFVGAVVTIICDQFLTWRRWMVTVVVCISGFGIGLVYVTEGGLLVLDLVDHYGAGFILYLIAILESVGICYVYGLNNFCNDIEFMIGRRPGLYWKVCWGLVLPLGLIINLFYYLGSEKTFTSGEVAYPIGYTIFGWLIPSLAAALVPLWAIYGMVTRNGSSLKEKFLEALKPSKSWGPQEPKLREDWEQFCDRKNCNEDSIPRLIYSIALDSKEIV